MKLRKTNKQTMITTEYRITDLAIRNIKATIPLMSKLMEHFNRGQRTVEKMLDAQDKRFQEPEVIEIIIGATGLYREQILEVVAAADSKNTTPDMPNPNKVETIL